MKTQVTLYLLLILVSWAEPANSKLDRFTIPWQFHDSYGKDSRLNIYDIDKSLFLKFEEKDKNVVFELRGSKAVMLEFDDRDEDVWAESVISAWKVNSATQVKVNLFDVRERAKPTLRFKNLPTNSAVVCFYKLGENGVENWIRVYEAVVNGELECELLDFGIWVCMALDRNGKPINEPSRIVNLNKNLISLHFSNLLRTPDEVSNEIDKAKFLPSTLPQLGSDLFKDLFNAESKEVRDKEVEDILKKYRKEK